MYIKILSCLILLIGLSLIAKGRTLKEIEILQIDSEIYHKIINDKASYILSALNTSILETSEKTLANEISIQEICLTEGCIHAAAKIISSMDKSINPCNDFYQFACGKFRKKTIPDNVDVTNHYIDQGKELRKDLRSIFEEELKENDPSYIKNVKNVYQICMNESQIEEIGIKEVKKIHEKNGGWPVVNGNEWNGINFNWENVIYKFRKDGISFNHLLSLRISDEGNLKNSIYISKPRFEINRDILIKGFEQLEVKAYFDYMVDIAVLFGADKELAKIDLKKSVEFEIELAKISSNEEDSNMKLNELQKNFSNIPWEEYLNNMLPENNKISKDDEITVSLSFVKKLEKLLAHTEKRTLSNYLIWRGTDSLTPYLPEVFRNRVLKFNRITNGNKKYYMRWEKCTDTVESTLRLAVGSYYIQKYFKNETKDKTQVLVTGIRKQIYDLVNKLDWMDEKTRNAALEKLAAMEVYIGYPQELINKEKLTKYYEELEINQSDSYLQTICKIKKFNYDKDYGKFNQVIKKKDWTSYSYGLVTNFDALYVWGDNTILLYAGLLKDAIIDGTPKYLNYGTTGFSIGHEMSHGFDDIGNQYDKDGNLNEWWGNQTKINFNQKAKCIEEQYGNFTDTQIQLKINGIKTLGENIADNVGAKLAYDAYQKWIKENGDDAKLPGLQEYSSNQMLWISLASSFCTAHKDEDLKKYINNEWHSPSEFRINGPLLNLVEFSKDFYCPQGSPMNPIKKCTFW